MVFFAALVAPLVFRVLPADHGGRFIRALFPRYYMFVGATAAAAAVALFPLSKLDSGLMAAVAGMTFWLRQSLMPRINTLSDRVKAGDAAAQPGFDRGHKLSVIANLLQMIVAFVVLAGFVL
jgi:F0F1-type ATP synthase assembly protein I